MVHLLVWFRSLSYTLECNIFRLTLRADNLLEDIWEGVGDEAAHGGDINSGRRGGEEDDDEEGDEGGDAEGVVFYEDGDIRSKIGDAEWAGEDSVDTEDTFSFVSIRSESLTSETVDTSGSNGVGNNSSLLESLSNIGLVPGMSLSIPGSL